jgi:hypothetical protein
MTADVEAATAFIHANARLLERHRLAHLLDGGNAEPAVQTLRAYRNPDGGFAHAIEPDMRAPVSQPVGVHTAMEILHEVGAHDDDLIRPAADWLTTVTRPDGAVPFCLPSAAHYPRAPWWQPADASSVTQTAANAAALHALEVQHPWLDGATEFLWRWLDELDPDDTEPATGISYDLLYATWFLKAVPDTARAEAALDALVPHLHTVVSAEPTDADVRTPLDLAPHPDSRARRMFDAQTIERHLDALAASQQDDGGWTFPWEAWNQAAGLEWRGILTVTALRTLRANGRV